MYLISKYTRPIQSIITMEFQSTLTTNQLQKREKQKKSNKFSLNTHLSEYIFRPLEQPLNQFQYIISESKKKLNTLRTVVHAPKTLIILCQLTLKFFR